MRVFLSSTSEDLKEFRAAACQVILEFDWHPVMMEHFGAAPERIVEACLQRVSQCKLMVLLLAHKHGWVPTKAQGGDGKRSIVEIELAQAISMGIPVIVLMADGGWPGNEWENERAEKREAIERFRREVDRLAVFFSHEQSVLGAHETLPQFKTRMRQALMKYQSGQKERRVAESDEGDEEIFDKKGVSALLLPPVKRPSARLLLRPAPLLSICGIGVLLLGGTVFNHQSLRRSEGAEGGKSPVFRPQTEAVLVDVNPFEGHEIYAQCHQLQSNNLGRFDLSAYKSCELLDKCMHTVYMEGFSLNSQHFSFRVGICVQEQRGCGSTQGEDSGMTRLAAREVGN